MLKADTSRAATQRDQNQEGEAAPSVDKRGSSNILTNERGENQCARRDTGTSLRQMMAETLARKSIAMK